MDEKESKKKPGLVFLSLCLIGIVAIGVSYAWWRFKAMQTLENTAISKCLKLELKNESDAISITNMYPISDEEGRKLTPYTFTLTNTCTVAAAYKLNMEMLEGTTLNSKYVAVMVNDADIKLLSSYDEATTVIDNSTESRTLDTGILIPNGSKDYSVSIWMDKSVTLEDDAQNKVFKSKIIVNAEATESPMDKIIADVDKTGKCPMVNDDGSVNVTGAEDTDGYVCSAKDAYGTSYYYRGNVTNNYVKFADKYWRIVRINGDGTVRVIYDGTSAHANGEKSTDRQIGTSAFNKYWKKDNVQESTNSSVLLDNAGVGYMYGNRDGIVEPTTQYSSTSFTNTSTYYIAKEYTYNASTDEFTLKNPIGVLGSAMTSDYVGYYTFNDTSSSNSYHYVYKITSVIAGSSSASVGYGYVTYGTTSKEKAQTNTNDSTIKEYLDNWYKTNIVGTTNEQYLADNVFCNDRSLVGNNTGTGAGTSTSYYRWYNGPWEGESYSKYNNKMMLTCPQQNDAFTVSDTTNGNGALTYPVGLLSMDEIVLAGGWNWRNGGYYLCSGQYWWTSSPSGFSGYFAVVRGEEDDGDANYIDFVSSAHGVRPVFNLKAEVLNNGDGTMNNPYHV